MARFAFLLGLVVSCARAGELPPGVVQALEAARIPSAAVAIVVQPVDSGPVLIAHNARQSMNPASVMKLVTAYAALDLLGPAWRWKTSVYADSPPVDGKLGGRLYMKGSGDPQFTVERLWSLLGQLRTRGLEHIGGDLVLDRSLFDLPTIDPGAFDDKPMRPYNVGPDALLINFQTLRFHLSAVDGKVRLLRETPAAGLAVENRLQLTRGACGSDWKESIATRLFPETGGHRLEITGHFSLACGEKNLYLAPLPANEQVAGLFRALWQESGGSLAGQVRSGSVPAAAGLLAESESPPLADIVRDMNKFSNNVMARQIFLTLGLTGEGPATSERARRRLAQWLAGRRLDFPELEIENGSGLSRRERISAESLNRLLQDAWKSPVMPELLASLPIVGSDGTMKKRLRESVATGRAHIKTGTLDKVKTAAGYAMDAQGRRHTVVFFINHPNAQAGGPAIDALLLWLAARGQGTGSGSE